MIRILTGIRDGIIVWLVLTIWDRIVIQPLTVIVIRDRSSGPGNEGHI